VSTPEPLGPIICLGGLIQSLFMRVREVPREGETVAAWDYDEPMDAGKAANYAVAAARLGAAVSLITVVGTDERGIRWRELLSREGIDTEWIRTAEGRTDVGVALLPPSKVPALVSVCDLSSHITPEFIRTARVAIEKGSIIVSSLECPLEAVVEAFAIARRRGIRTVLNASPAIPLPEALTSLVDVVVVNEREAAVLAKREGNAATLASVLVAELAVPAVIVTAGPDGAYLATPVQGLTHVPGLPVSEVVDTTGAGDAFLGALASRLREGDELPSAITFGVGVATVSVGAMSTMPSYPSSAELAESLSTPPEPPSEGHAPGK
jgi:ribokinase